MDDDNISRGQEPSRPYGRPDREKSEDKDPRPTTGGRGHGRRSKRHREPQEPALLFPKARPVSYYFDVLKRRRTLVTIVSVTIFFVAAVYTLTATPFYRSTGVLEFKSADPKKGADILEEVSEETQFRRYYATQQELLKMGASLEPLIAAMDLEKSPEFSVKKSLWSRIVGVFSNDTETTRADRIKSLVKQLEGRVQVKPVRNSNLISVSMEAKQPLFASEMLKKYFDIFLERNIQKRRQESIDSRDWLKKELAETEKQLARAESRLMEFTSKHGIIATEDGKIQNLMEGHDKTVEGAVRSGEKRVRVESVKRANGSTETLSVLPGDIKAEYLDKLKQELAMMEAEYAQQQGFYSTTSPKMIMLNRKIQALRKQVSQMESQTVATALDSAKKEEEYLKSALKDAKDEAMRITSLSGDYMLLRKQVETSRYLYNELLKRIKEMDIKASATVNNISVAEPPSVPSSPVRPKKSLYLLLGLCAAVGGGIFAAMFAESMDKTLRTTEDSQRLLGLPSLGVLPDLKRLGRIGENGSDSRINELVAFGCPASPMSDAVKNVKTSLLLLTAQRPPKVVLVSSAVPGEGKTLLTISLASVLTLDKQTRVLIVDADLRRPRVHQVFEGENAHLGLSSLLDGGPPGLTRAIRQSSVPNLSYVPAGPIPQDPMILLESRRMPEIISEFKAEFDFIFIDCPPLLGLPDTRLLSTFADAIVIVARQGRPEIKDLQACLEFVPAQARSKIVGLVLNGADPKLSGGYGGYYSYYSYYRRDGKSKNPVSRVRKRLVKFIDRNILGRA